MAHLISDPHANQGTYNYHSDARVHPAWHVEIHAGKPALATWKKEEHSGYCKKTKENA